MFPHSDDLSWAKSRWFWVDFARTLLWGLSFGQQLYYKSVIILIVPKCKDKQRLFVMAIDDGRFSHVQYPNLFAHVKQVLIAHSRIGENT